jgi:glycosyltransferase involved in cell wall biosynthesis
MGPLSDSAVPSAPVSERHRRQRILLVGPTFAPDDVGGLQIALGEVAQQLRLRGWDVDSRIHATFDSRAPSPASAGGLRDSFVDSRLARLLRWGWTLRPAIAAPARLRAFLNTLLLPPAYYRNASHNLAVVERLLSEPRQYDLVLVCVDGSPPGLSALVARRHPCVVMISLSGLPRELDARWWLFRMLGRSYLDGKSHPALFRPVKRDQIRMAVFANRQWREEAVLRGLPLERTRTIYFGIPPMRPRSPRGARGSRLLWVGRMSLEKGPHLLVEALPTLRRRFPDVSLSIVAGQGPEQYRNLVLRLIERHGLRDIVTLHDAVERSRLRQIYAAHDVLFYHSRSADPVALVLMEAFAIGLPVVASRAGRDAGLVREEVTCLCYRPGDRDSLTAAVSRLLQDEDLRRALTTNALRLVRRDFSLKKMGREYDQSLRECVTGSA